MVDFVWWEMGDITKDALKDEPVYHNSYTGGEAGPCEGDRGTPSEGWLILAMLSIGSQLCVWTGEQCAESSVMDYALFCWSGSGWWMDGRSIQNTNVVLKWGHISLKLILKWLLLLSGFDLLQENWSWKKGNSRGWNVQIRHLIYTICHIPISPQVGSLVYLAVVVGFEFPIVGPTGSFIEQFVWVTLVFQTRLQILQG